MRKERSFEMLGAEPRRGMNQENISMKNGVERQEIFPIGSLNADVYFLNYMNFMSIFYDAAGDVQGKYIGGNFLSSCADEGSHISGVSMMSGYAWGLVDKS